MAGENQMEVKSFFGCQTWATGCLNSTLTRVRHALTQGLSAQLSRSL